MLLFVGRRKRKFRRINHAFNRFLLCLKFCKSALSARNISVNAGQKDSPVLVRLCRHLSAPKLQARVIPNLWRKFSKTILALQAIST